MVQVAPEVGGFVTELAVNDHQEVKKGAPLFQIDKRPYQYRADQANAKLTEVQETGLTEETDLEAVPGHFL